jgi:hypothetical protein
MIYRKRGVRAIFSLVFVGLCLFPQISSAGTFSVREKLVNAISYTEPFTCFFQRFVGSDCTFSFKDEIELPSVQVPDMGPYVERVHTAFTGIVERVSASFAAVGTASFEQPTDSYSSQISVQSSATENIFPSSSRTIALATDTTQTEAQQPVAPYVATSPALTVSATPNMTLAYLDARLAMFKGELLGSLAGTSGKKIAYKSGGGNTISTDNIYRDFNQSIVESVTNITELTTLTSVGTLSSGAITSGFGSIDIGSESISAGVLALINASATSTIAGNLDIAGTTDLGKITIDNLWGNSGQVLRSNGTGTAPTWGTVATGISIGDAISSGTAGSALYVDASGNLAQDNSNFFWDATNDRLGIGTNAPTANLTVNGGTGSAILSLQDAVTGATASDGLEVSMADDWAFLWNYENGPVLIGANNEERMRITADGDTFLYSGGSTNYNGLILRTPFGAAQKIIADYGGTGVEQPLILGTWSNNADQLTLATSGNVGIGTTTPSAKLTIQGTAGNQENLATYASSTGATLGYIDSTGGVAGALGASATSFYIGKEPTDSSYTGIWQGIEPSSRNFNNYTFLRGAGDTFFNSPEGGRMQYRIVNGTQMSLDANGLVIGSWTNANSPTTQQTTIIPSSASKIGLVVKGASSQVANLQDWVDSSDTILASITASGGLDLIGDISSESLITTSTTTSSTIAGPLVINELINNNSDVSTNYLWTDRSRQGEITTNENGHNILIGYNAYNTLVPSPAQYAAYNVVIGGNAMSYATNNRQGHTAIGDSALRYVGGNNSTGVGRNAGYYAAGGGTFFGYSAGAGASSYSQPGTTAIGGSSLAALITGDGYNTALGQSAGALVSSGSYNTLLGASAGDNITTGSSNIMIGYNVEATSATGDNQLNIGNTIYGDLSTGRVGIGAMSPSGRLDLGVSPDGTSTFIRAKSLSQYSGGDASASAYFIDYSLNEPNHVTHKLFTVSGSGNVASAGSITAGTTVTAGTSGGFVISGGWGGLYGNTSSGPNNGNSITSAYNLFAVPGGTYAQGRGAFAVVNGTTPVRLHVYNTYTNASNYERGVFDWRDNNTLHIGTEAAGTGSVRNISLVGGNVGIGTTTPAAKFSITQSANDATGGLYIAEAGDTDFRSAYMDTSGILSFYGGDTAGTLNTATLNAAGEWTNASDRAYKDNIEDLAYGLDAVLALQPRSYTIKDTNIVRLGFIAQEMELVLPELVSGEEGKKGISYGNLTSVLVKAIQELAQQVGDVKDQATSTFLGWFNFRDDKYLCIDEVCVTKEQLKEILRDGGASERAIEIEPEPTREAEPELELTPEPSNESEPTPQSETEGEVMESIETEETEESAEVVEEEIPVEEFVAPEPESEEEPTIESAPQPEVEEVPSEI